VYDFHETDIENGGNGRPLSPVFYRAMIRFSTCRELMDDKQTVAVVNTDDMANVTIVGPRDELVAFDAGPGSALVNEYIQRCFQKSDDRFGELACKGEVVENVVNRWMDMSCLNIGRKSFDLSDFMDCLNYATKALIPVDCVASLTALTAKLIIKSISEYNNIGIIVLTGRERRNEFLKTLLNRSYSIIPADYLQWDEDFGDAEQCAFYAVRSLFSMPTTFPETTGTSKPTCCGKLIVPESFCPRRRPQHLPSTAKSRRSVSS
jgi:anhydro-N-acetylmuramic acid kinase